MGLEDEVNDALDAALEMTFPASDPIAVSVPARHSDTRIRTRRNGGRGPASGQRKREGTFEVARHS